MPGFGLEICEITRMLRDGVGALDIKVTNEYRQAPRTTGSSGYFSDGAFKKEGVFVGTAKPKGV